MSIAIYIRGKKDSQENQIKHMKSFLGSRFKEADIYNDEYVSGIDKNRPELNSLVRNAEEYDTIYVYNVATLTRNATHFLELSIAFELKNVNLVFIESDILKKYREKEMIRTKLPKQAPYGYKRVGNTIQIEKYEADIIKIIFELYSKEEIGLYDIYYTLQEEHILTRNGKEFLPSTISNILSNEAYIGNFYYNKSTIIHDKDGRKRLHNNKNSWKVLNNVFPPIIEKDLFNKIQLKKQHRKSMYGGELQW